MTPAEPGFRHEALLYAGGGEFAAAVAAYVRAGLDEGEPVMVAVPEPRAALLRDELGADAGRVRFADMAQIGRNPARIIPAWQFWVDENLAARRPFRGVGEHLWPGRTEAEISECRQHDALVSTAFADGPGWNLLCAFDTAELGDEIIERVAQDHPVLLHKDGLRRPSPGYQPPEAPLAVLAADPLPAPPAQAFETGFDRGDLAGLRRIVAERAAAAGLEDVRAKDLVLAVNELVCNSIEHGGGGGVLSLWEDQGALVGEVRDRGIVHDPLIGRRRPTGSAQGGAGLWIVNQVCDLVQLRVAPDSGVTVRVQVSL